MTRRNLQLFYPHIHRMSNHCLNLISFIGRILIVRRLFIQTSLKHAPHMPLSYHIQTVREMEHMMLIQKRKEAFR